VPPASLICGTSTDTRRCPAANAASTEVEARFATSRKESLRVSSTSGGGESDRARVRCVAASSSRSRARSILVDLPPVITVFLFFFQSAVLANFFVNNIAISHAG